MLDFSIEWFQVAPEFAYRNRMGYQAVVKNLRTQELSTYDNRYGSWNASHEKGETYKSAVPELAGVLARMMTEAEKTNAPLREELASWAA